MLAVKPQGKIVRKIVRAKTGEFVLAVFLVVEREGEVQFQLLSVKPIGEAGIKNHELGTGKGVLCLAGGCLKSPAVTLYRHNHSVVSPFFNTLEFFVSQPTRAPSAN